MARVDPLPPAAWPPQMRAILSTIAPPADKAQAPVKGRVPQALNNLGMFAHHPDLARGFFALNAHLLHTTTLEERQRMLIVLRVATVRRSSYLWAVQTHLGRSAGLSDEEISRVAWGPAAPYWGQLDASLLRAVDELIDDGAIAPDTWTQLAAEMDVRQILDVIFTAGSYELLSYMFRSFDVALDADLLEDFAPSRKTGE